MSIDDIVGVVLLFIVSVPSYVLCRRLQAVQKRIDELEEELKNLIEK